MPTRKAPRKGSLQYWPRKRAKKFLPRVNWSTINSSKPLKGFICYKAGMCSAIVKDNTPDSMTAGKTIALPSTILECPPMRIFSVRFYSNKLPVSDILSDNLDKELKSKVKLPKKVLKKIDDVATDSYDDIAIIAYSKVKNSGLKKTPDIVEIGLSGSKEDKLKFVKENLGKDISIVDVLEKNQLVDFRGLSTGKGFQGSVKRFGVTLRSHKSEKGRRGPGSIGPWHPARVTFRVPMAGQMGFQTRVAYNSNVLDFGKATDSKHKLKNVKNYGDLKTEYVIVNGSVHGPSKRQVVLTAAMRPTKKQAKKVYELEALR